MVCLPFASWFHRIGSRRTMPVIYGKRIKSGGAGNHRGGGERQWNKDLWEAGALRRPGGKGAGWATKCGNVRGTAGSWRGVNGKPEYVRSCCEASLRRLGVGVIDLYYQHRVDPDTPIEETVGAMADLVRQGKGGDLGVSGAGPRPAR